MGVYSIMPPSAISPGFMPGLKEIHAKFATKDWADLCADAVRWAETGHEVSTFEYGVNIFGEKFITYFPEGRDFYQTNGYFPTVGDVFTSPGIAERKSAVEGTSVTVGVALLGRRRSTKTKQIIITRKTSQP